jgi:hypothetical protein
LAFGEAAVEDRERVGARTVMATTRRLAQQPDDAEDDESPKEDQKSANGRSEKLAEST